MNAVSAQTKCLQGAEREKEVGQRKGYTFIARLLQLENQPESLLNETISLTSMGDSSVKLTRVEEPNNLYLHLARD